MKDDTEERLAAARKARKGLISGQAAMRRTLIPQVPVVPPAPKKKSSVPPEFHQWELIQQGSHEATDRMLVPGGWLYRTIILSDKGDMEVALTFVRKP